MTAQNLIMLALAVVAVLYHRGYRLNVVNPADRASVEASARRAARVVEEAERYAGPLTLTPGTFVGPIPPAPDVADQLRQVMAEHGFKPTEKPPTLVREGDRWVIDGMAPAK